MTLIHLHMILAFSAFSVSIIIGLFVWLKNPQNAVNRYFGYFNLAVGLWNSGDFLSILLS